MSTHVPAPSSELLAFQRALAGRYSIERELGRGGMGIVFLAREVALERVSYDGGNPPAVGWGSLWIVGRVLVSRGREVQQLIKRRIELALDGRSWKWLAQKAGVPQSTLADQAAKPRFSIEVLVLVAEALGTSMAWFFTDSDRLE